MGIEMIRRVYELEYWFRRLKCCLVTNVEYNNNNNNGNECDE